METVLSRSYSTIICLAILLLGWLPEGATQHQFIDITRQVDMRHHAYDRELRIVGGIVTLDFDNNGLYDLYLPGGNNQHRLYKNIGDFNFKDVTTSSGLADVPWASSGANAADLNNDGWQDLFITTLEGYSNVCLINNQDGTFTDKSAEYGFDAGKYWGTSVTFADFNDDGILDVYVGNYADYDDGETKRERKKPFPNQLFMSTSKYHWEEVAADFGVEGYAYTLVVYAVDLDLDHDMDIYVGNDFGQFGRTLGNRYYENQGDGSFIEKSEEVGLDINMFAMGIDVTDYGGDGDLDTYLSDLERNRYLENTNGTFADFVDDVYALGDYVSWGATFFDSNNNGLEDLFIVNGEITGTQDQPNQYYEYYQGLYIGTNMNSFSHPFYGRGSAIADFDDDGDEDVIIHPTTGENTVETVAMRVFRNNNQRKYSHHGWLDVHLEGVSSNRNGYGSVLTLKLENGKETLKTADNGGRYMSGGPDVVHFGCGEEEIASLEVCWPSGDCRSYTGIPKKAAISINEETGVEVLYTALVSGSHSKYNEKLTARMRNNVLYLDGLTPNEWTNVSIISMDGRITEKRFNSDQSPYLIHLGVGHQSNGLMIIQVQQRGRLSTFKLMNGT